MTPKELIKHLEAYEPGAIIAYDIWQVDDVLGSTEEQITREEAEEVIHRMEQNKDCTIGLNWDVLAYHLDNVIDERKN
jgi:hypothetical protein